MAKFDRLLVLIMGGFVDDEKDANLSFDWIDDPDYFDEAYKDVVRESKDENPYVLMVGNTPEGEEFEKQHGKTDDDHWCALGPIFLRVPRRVAESAPKMPWIRFETSQVPGSTNCFMLVRETRDGVDIGETKQLLFMDEY